jgi:hypothetical protein
VFLPGAALIDPIHDGRLVDGLAVVEAANTLLVKRRFPYRFFALDVALGLEAFVAVGASDALLLQYGGVLAAPDQHSRDEHEDLKQTA